MNHAPRRLLPPARRRLPGSRGFTLIEVALASFVMALGIATSIIAMQSGLKFLDVARDTTLASQILQSEIERIRMMNWGDVKNLVEEEPVNLSSMFTTETSPDPADVKLAARFSVKRRVVPDSTRPDDVRLITLSVTWTSFDGRSHTRSFQSKYVNNGLYDYYYTLARP